MSNTCTVVCEMFVLKIFRAIIFHVNRTDDPLPQVYTCALIFRAFNFRTTHCVRKYFNNENVIVSPEVPLFTILHGSTVKNDRNEEMKWA